MEIVSIIVLVLAIVLLLLFLFGIFFLKISVLHDSIGRREETYRSKLSPTYSELFSWFDSLKEQGCISDLFITNREQLKLHAYYLPCENAKGTAIMVHGYSGCALQTLPHARMYREKFSYNVLMVDLAHHAQSEGKITQMGWKDRLDLLQWMDVLLDRFPETKELPIVLHGLSMGGSTVLMTGGETLPQNVKALIDDSGFTSAYDEFAYEIRHKMHLPPTPFIQAANIVGRLFLGWFYSDASALKQMPKIELPVMIIHGDADVRVLLRDGKRLYEAKSRGEKEMWVVPNGTHIRAIFQYPDEYEQRVANFLSKSLV